MATAYWMRVTPSGITRARPRISELAAGLGADLQRIAVIVRAELKATYFGKSFGWLWLLLEPLLLAGAYWFLTAVLWELRPEDTHHFLSILLSLVFWIWFARTLNAAPLMLTGNAGLLRDTDFPVTLVLGVTLGKELVNFAFSFAVTLALLLFLGVRPGWALASFPLVWLAQFLVLVCSSIALALVGVFIKDFAAILANLLPFVWFLSPVIYPIALLERRAPALIPFVKLNPLYYLLPAYESIFISNRVPPLGPLLVMIGVCVPAFLFGWRLFRRARYRYYSHL